LGFVALGGMLCILYSCSLIRSAPPEFEVKTVKTVDRVGVTNKTNLTIFDIFSPGGIGGAEIHLASGKIPPQIVLRLHLKGLEEFRFSANGETILVSVSSSGENRITQSYRREKEKTGDWQVIDTNSLYWTELKIVSKNSGTGSKIPVKEGHFEVEVPEYILKKEVSGFSLHWIDFFRE
jgi:hypothetical protein